MTERRITLGHIANTIQAKVVGDEQHEVTNLATLDSAGPQSLTFLSNPQFKNKLLTTRAQAIIVHERDINNEAKVNWLVVDNPYLAYAKVTTLFDRTPPLPPGIDDSAIVSKDAIIGKNVHIAPQVVVEAGAKIGNDAVIGAGTYIGHDCQIGAQTKLYPRVTLYPRTELGQRCIIHSGAVLGADGFGIANDQGRWVKIEQLGRVIIGDDVELGANTCVDRGAIEDTVLGSGVKIDNMCHLGHNVRIGENTVMAAFTAVAGSAIIGKQCTIAGGSGILGHTEMADRTTVTARTFVSGSITEPGTAVSSGTTMQSTKGWRRSVGRFKQLDELFKRILRLEKKLQTVNDDK